MSQPGGEVTPMDFSSIIAPIDEADFFSIYWEKEPLHIPKQASNGLELLLTLETMNRLLSEVMFRADECKVARSGEIVPPSVYISELGMRVMEKTATDYVNTAKLLSLFEQGATLVFSQLNHKHHPLQVLKETIERQLSATAITNVFLSNRNSQGFSLHYDSHDVFVLQLHGYKIWSLYDSPLELPLKSQAFGSTGVRAGPLSSEIRLDPGDVLYVPRGYFHEAKTTDAVSLHLTIGVHPYLWVDYLNDLIKRIGSQTPALRKSVPMGFMRTSETGKETLIRDALLELSNTAGLGKLAGEVHAAAIDRKIEAGTHAVPDHLREILAASDLSLQSRLIRRDAAAPLAVTARASAIAVTYQGRSLQFPASHGPMIEMIRQDDEFTVADLPGDLQLELKIRFVSRLIGLGLLTLARKSAPRKQAELAL